MYTQKEDLGGGYMRLNPLLYSTKERSANNSSTKLAERWPADTGAIGKIMRQAATNDVLTPEDLESITGVTPRAHNRIPQIKDVLDQAGIYHWLNKDGLIVTTWHHVHVAGKVVKQAVKTLPTFEAAS